MKMTDKELNKALEAHVKWLRGEPGGALADLSDEDLRGSDLSTADLTGADLHGADLRGAKLSGVKCTTGRLGTNLAVADLHGANLSGVDLSDADLSGANLEGANLTGADLAGAMLEGTRLTGAILEGAKLEGTDMSRSYFGSIIGEADEVEVINKKHISSGGRWAYTVLEVEDGGCSCLVVKYPQAERYENPNKNTTVAVYKLKAGFFNKPGNRRIEAYNVDLSQAMSVRGATFGIKDLLKAEGFRWNQAEGQWRKTPDTTA